MKPSQNPRYCSHHNRLHVEYTISLSPFVQRCIYNVSLLDCLTGPSSSLGPGDGSEDEQAQQQQSQHVERGPADEPALPSMHTQVCEAITDTPCPCSACSVRRIFQKPA